MAVNFGGPGVTPNLGSLVSNSLALQPGEVFLMNPTAPDSLDGRYFGPLPASSIVGRAVPLWTDEGDDGRFVWRAATH